MGLPYIPPHGPPGTTPVGRFEGRPTWHVPDGSRLGTSTINPLTRGFHAGAPPSFACHSGAERASRRGVKLALEARAWMVPH